jgi:DNA helicase-2/ATP-dependent DNA helicase PcrA
VDRFQPREGQRQILDYEGGMMGVSAVPGSGKTATIVALATRLIAEGRTAGGQVLIVTYQNAAVDNVRARIRQRLEEMNLLQVGNDVRTLHSLSYGIVQANSGLVGAASEFAVLDERSSGDLLDKAVRIWNAQHKEVWGRLGPGDYVDDRWEQEWRDIARKVARTVITTAKNRRLRAEDLLARIGGGDELNQFLRIGAEIYQLYQQQVETIGGLDFDDLVWMAVELLQQYPDLCARYRQRWPLILEDEAQDSIPLQEDLLSLLAGPGGQWIRVGDPNQAIMSTFTAADPRYLRRFLERDDVEAQEMAISGRCAPKIIDLANFLVEWASVEHPLAEVRERAFRPQRIVPTDRDDPQQNPPDAESAVSFREYNNRLEEFASISRRAKRFIAEYPEATVAVLVPTNRIGYELAERLREVGADFDEVLQSPRSARQVGETLSQVLFFLAEPLGRNHLERAYRALVGFWPGPTGSGDEESVATLLRSCYRPEALLYPAAGARMEEALPPVDKVEPQDLEAIMLLCSYLRRWLRAVSLPVDQLLVTVAQDLLAEGDLARAQKLATYLRTRADQNTDWRLPELARELSLAVQGRTGVLAGEEDIFAPKPGRISLTTMHKAKGMEWDLVYVMGVDGYWFPHDLDAHFLGEYEFLGGDPCEEARAELLGLIGEIGSQRLSATNLAHVEIIAERLRLLYVAITRARRYLAISWSREIPRATRSHAVPMAESFRQLEAYYLSKNR